MQTDRTSRVVWILLPQTGEPELTANGPDWSLKTPTGWSIPERHIQLSHHPLHWVQPFIPFNSDILLYCRRQRTAAGRGREQISRENAGRGTLAGKKRGYTKNNGEGGRRGETEKRGGDTRREERATNKCKLQGSVLAEKWWNVTNDNKPETERGRERKERERRKRKEG